MAIPGRSYRPEFLLELNEIARPQCIAEGRRVVGLATRR